MGEKEARTIFWPPGPLPFRKASSMSDSEILGRGGICLMRPTAVLANNRCPY